MSHKWYGNHRNVRLSNFFRKVWYNDLTIPAISRPTDNFCNVLLRTIIEKQTKTNEPQNILPAVKYVSFYPHKTPTDPPRLWVKITMKTDFLNELQFCVSCWPNRRPQREWERERAKLTLHCFSDHFAEKLVHLWLQFFLLLP